MQVCKVNRILGGLFPSRPTRRQKKGWHGLRQQHGVLERSPDLRAGCLRAAGGRGASVRHDGR